MSRKHRVYRFTRKDGTQAVNSTTLLYPFKDMELGDHFTVSAAEVVYGNLVALTSVWGKRLNARFSCRALGKEICVTRTE